MGSIPSRTTSALFQTYHTELDISVASTCLQATLPKSWIRAVILLKILPWAPRMSPCIQRGNRRLGWPQPCLFSSSYCESPCWRHEDQPKYKMPILGDLELFLGKPAPFDFATMCRETLLTMGHWRGSCHQFPGGDFSRSLQGSREGGVVQGWILPAQVSLPNLGRSMGHKDIYAIISSAPTAIPWQASKNQVREQ